jgi:hypothetical protein
MAAGAHGATLIKVFPCGNVGGPKCLKALRGPFPQLKIIPTVGVNLSNVAEYIAAGAFALGVGSDLVDTGAPPGASGKDCDSGSGAVSGGPNGPNTNCDCTALSGLAVLRHLLLGKLIRQYLSGRRFILAGCPLQPFIVPTPGVRIIAFVAPRRE